MRYNQTNIRMEMKKLEDQSLIHETQTKHYHELFLGQVKNRDLAIKFLQIILYPPN
jgi:hypothetical protein